ncbi:MAG TPA: hypothetical protein VJ602_01160 [Paludibacter sp.]|nr:hypothetical protein [Paludibacter sp.]
MYYLISSLHQHSLAFRIVATGSCLHDTSIHYENEKTHTDSFYRN